MRSWTQEEDEYIRRHRSDGAKAIAAVINRTPTAVAKQAYRMGCGFGKPHRPRSSIDYQIPDELVEVEDRIAWMRKRKEAAQKPKEERWQVPEMSKTVLSTNGHRLDRRAGNVWV